MIYPFLCKGINQKDSKKTIKKKKLLEFGSTSNFKTSKCFEGIKIISFPLAL